MWNKFIELTVYYCPHPALPQKKIAKQKLLSATETSCKVIRVDTRTTNYKQSPTTVNIDRPAHIKTDKQCRTHTTSIARLPDD